MFIGLGMGSWLEMGLGIGGASRGAFRNMFRVWFGGLLWSPFGVLLGLLFQVGLEGLFEVILGCVWDWIRREFWRVVLEHHDYDFWAASEDFLRLRLRQKKSKMSKKVERVPYTICVRNPYTNFVRNPYTSGGIPVKIQSNRILELAHLRPFSVHESCTDSGHGFGPGRILRGPFWEPARRRGREFIKSSWGSV